MSAIEPILLQRHNDIIRSLAFSPDGRLLASLSILTDKRVILWETEAWLPVAEFYCGPGTTNLWFSSDGATLLGTGVNREVRLWDVASGVAQVLPCIDINPLVRFVTPANTYLIFCHDGVADYYDLQTQRLARRLSPPPSFSSIFRHCGWISNDARLLAIEDRDHSIQLWDTTKETTLLRLIGNNSGIRDIDFHPAGASLASVNSDGTIIIWDLSSGGIVRSFTSARTDVWEVLLNPVLPVLAVTFEEEKIELWDTASGTLLTYLPGHAPQITAAYSPDGTLLASGSEDAIVRIWLLSQ